MELNRPKMQYFLLFTDELMVIVEYCRYGNLKDVLEKHRHNVKNQNTDSNTVQMIKSRAPAATAISVTRNNLASWSYQIAQGMQFLASQKIVHGNLGARAILLAEGNIAKISDFGLARSMYKTETYIAEKEVQFNLNKNYVLFFFYFIRIVFNFD